MGFYWLRDHIKKVHFKLFWRTGKYDLADYFMNLYLESNHRVMIPTFNK